MLQRASFRYMLALYVLDMAATLGSLHAALLARRAWPLGKIFVEQYGGLNPVIFTIALVAWTVAFVASGAYDPRRILRTEREITRVLAAIAIASLLFAGALYFSYRAVSRLLVVYFIVLDTVSLVTVRLLLRILWRSIGVRRLPTSRILIIGAGALGQDMARSFQEHDWMGLEVVGFLDDDPAKHGQDIGGLPVLGSLQDAPRIVAERGITDVVLALPLRAHKEMANVVARLEQLPVNIKVAPDLGPLVFYRMTVETFGDIPLIGLKEPVIRPHQRVLKRMMDVTISAAALLVSLPAWLPIALAIKLDSPGPVIFRQQRVGEGGKPFTMYKFRTMHVGAEQMERGIVENALALGAQHFKSPDDPRVTRVGRFLRRTSLDELPQLWNVLKGDMSLVGPRPELPAFVEHYEPWQRKRFGVPQGLTGWWQVHERGDKPMYWHTEDDLYYIQNYSLLLDIRILLLTALAVIRGRGAY
ncbi:MAG: sugar transferase [Anaerolineae bacterium]